MKKTLFKVLPLAAALLASSCSKDDSDNVVSNVDNNAAVVGNETTESAAKKTHTFSITVSYDANSLSKATIESEPVGYTEDIKVVFEVGDKLNLSLDGDESNHLLESEALTDAEAGKSTAKFIFTVTEEDYNNYESWPLRATIGDDSDDFSEYEGFPSLTDAVKKRGYWMSTETFLLAVDGEGNYYVEDMDQVFLEQQRAFIVNPSKLPFRLSGMIPEAYKYYAVEYNTEIQPMFKTLKNAERGRVYFIPEFPITETYTVNDEDPLELNLSYSGNLTWSSSDVDEEVLFVDNGVIYPIGEGVAYIRVKSDRDDEPTLYYKIVVEN